MRIASTRMEIVRRRNDYAQMHLWWSELRNDNDDKDSSDTTAIMTTVISDALSRSETKSYNLVFCV